MGPGTPAFEDPHEATTDEPNLPGLLYGVIRHAEGNPGRLSRVDTSVAKAAGAIVLTGQETLVIDPYHGPVVRDRSLLAIDRVRYRGEPVVAVAAATPDAAREAAASIVIDVTPLSATMTGARPGEAPLVHLTDLLRKGPFAEQAPLVYHGRNLVARVKKNLDHPAAVALSQPLAIALPPVAAPGPLVATARWQEGHLTVWSNGGPPEAVETELAMLFNCSPDLITVIPYSEAGRVTVPGVLGIEGIAAALARRARKPVRLTADAADFGWSGPRATITANAKATHLTIDAGAFAGYLPLWLDELADVVATRFGGATIVVELVYSERPPVAATLDDWTAALTADRTASTISDRDRP